MDISSLNGYHSTVTLRLTQMRSQFTDLQRQLGTEQKSETYGGLGGKRGLDVALRSRLTEVQSWQNTIDHVGLRLDIAGQTLERVTDIALEVADAADPNSFDVLPNGLTTGQNIAHASLAELVGLLNTDVGGRYLFGGRKVDDDPVAKVDPLLKGDGTRAGFNQVVEERRQADLGPTVAAGNLGRLDVSSAGTTVTVAEDGAHPFGFKLEGVNSTLSNVTVTGPAGSPATMDVDFAGQPATGETIRVFFTLPDGSDTDIELTVGDGVEEGTFALGATPADTAANFEAALTDTLATTAATTLRSASAMAAADNFFNTTSGTEPQRVDGPPFDTATALVDGGATTIEWYQGDNTADDPRAGVTARVDDSLSVSYGMRANEEGLVNVIKSVAVYATQTFTAGDDIDEERHAALAERVYDELADQSGSNTLRSLVVEVATMTYTVDRAEQRQVAMAGTLTEAVEGIEGVNLEEVAAKLLGLQTLLQANYTTMARMADMSLTNYI